MSPRVLYRRYRPLPHWPCITDTFWPLKVANHQAIRHASSALPVAMFSLAKATYLFPLALPFISSSHSQTRRARGTICGEAIKPVVLEYLEATVTVVQFDMFVYWRNHGDCFQLDFRFGRTFHKKQWKTLAKWLTLFSKVFEYWSPTMRANRGDMLRTIYIGPRGRMWTHRDDDDTRKAHTDSIITVPGIISD